MESLTQIRSRIQSVLSDRYRTVWIQRAGRHMQKDVLVTLFPHGFGQYQIVSLRGLKDISYEEILNGINTAFVDVV